MTDSPLFPRVPFQWHFDLSQGLGQAEMGSPDGSIYIGQTGEWGCAIEGITLASYVRPVLSILTQEIGESEPKWVATIAPENPDTFDFYGFTSLGRLPLSHFPFGSSLRLPPNISVFIRPDFRGGTMMLTWEMTEENGDLPLTWEDSQSDGYSPRFWEMTSLLFQFMKGCVLGRSF